MTDLKFDLIKELKLEHLSEKEKDEMREKYAEILEEKISSRIMDELPEEKVKEIEKIITEGKNDEANKYIVDNVPNLDIIAREEFELLKNRIIEMNQALQTDNIEKIKN